MKKKKGKKKIGFTLIELLAVIVILAIIALIIVPIISNVIDASRKAAFRDSVNGIIDSTNGYVSAYVLNNKDDLKDYPVIFTCDGSSCTNGSYTLEFKGSVPKGGRIIIQSGGVLSEYITDGTYCAYGYKWDMQVGNNCGEVDYTKPTITVTLTGKTVTITMTDDKSGIDKYCVTNTNTADECAWITPTNLSSETYEITAPGTWYFFAKDTNGNISDSVSVTVPESEFNYEATLTTYTASSSQSSYAATPHQNCAEYHAAGWSGSCPSDCHSNCVNYNDGSGGWECNKWGCSTSYSCPNGGSESGGRCYTTSYSCNAGDRRDGTTCYHYDCPQGGTLQGTTCVR